MGVFVTWKDGGGPVAVLSEPWYAPIPALPLPYCLLLSGVDEFLTGYQNTVHGFVSSA